MNKHRYLAIVTVLLLMLCACGNDTAAEAEVTVKTTVQQTVPTETQMEVSDWERFRAYLQENGDAVTEKDLSTNADTLTRKTVVKGKEEEILVRFEMINRQNVSGYSTFGKATARFSFPENARTVDVEFLVEISASKGSQKEVSTYEGTYNWDISQYAEGDEVVGKAVYNYIDKNGNYTHKNETVGYQITGIIEPVCDALRKSLSDSGLGITMADLGFVSY